MTPVAAIGRHAPGRRLARRSEPFAIGALAAAAVAGDYDGESTHGFRLGDCVLAKLNLLGRAKPRRNRRRVEHPDRAWVRGFATALAEVYRLLADGSEAAGIRAIARAAGIDLASARKAQVSAYDLRALARAGVR